MGRLTIDLSGQSAKLPTSLRKDEPTHVSRYWVISQILHSVVDKNSRILDVGGKEGLLRSFGFNPTIIDMEASNEPNFIHGNALDMPFRDKDFKISVSCDVLEHIAEVDRAQFIAEMVRVSDIAVICAPFSHAGMDEAETDINNYYKSLLKTGHRWLQEHIDNGLPSEEQTAKVIKTLGYNFVKVRHFSLDLWPLVLKSHLLHAAFGDSAAIVNAAKEIYQLYYDELCTYDYGENGYRTFFVISKDELQLKLPPPQDIARKKNLFLDSFTSTLLEAIEGQARGLRKNNRQNNELKKKLDRATVEAKGLADELTQIKASRSWRIAQALARAKRLGK